MCGFKERLNLNSTSFQILTSVKKEFRTTAVVMLSVLTSKDRLNVQNIMPSCR